MAQQSTDIERACAVCGDYAGQMVAFNSGCRWICGPVCEAKFEDIDPRDEEVVSFVDELVSGLSAQAEEKLRALLRRKS